MSSQKSTEIVEAARRLIDKKGEGFTTQELIKESGVALQTFYRHFGSKDQLFLAVLETLIRESAEQYEAEARSLRDPLARLRSYIGRVLGAPGTSEEAIGPRFVTAEHWRLYQLYPDQVNQAMKPFTDLVLREIRAAQEAGRVRSKDPERDAWLITTLVRGVFHHYAFASGNQPATTAEDVWAFCLGAIGGKPPRSSR